MDNNIRKSPLFVEGHMIIFVILLIFTSMFSIKISAFQPLPPENGTSTIVIRNETVGASGGGLPPENGTSPIVIRNENIMNSTLPPENGTSPIVIRNETVGNSTLPPENGTSPL